MCSDFLKMMDNYQGDLADIVRATTNAAVDAGTTSAEASSSAAAEWQFPRNPINYSSDYFGDPFTYTRDPLTPNISHLYNSNIINGGSGATNIAHKVLDEETNRPTNIFSRMLQISPNAAKVPPLPPPSCDALAGAAAPAERVLRNNSSILASNNCALISSPSTSVLQISSPRNTGIKRRKSQGKKVVCIPAPAPANNKSTGEVVPSDLWAWRKYGQKPIKGSPFPRGYYRCSSSKGCSARKQVERSRTDPNMLVITYTSEHNHPWPTQRNALAGSTRSHATKNSINGAKESSSPNSHQTEKPRADETSSTSPLEETVKEELNQPHFEPEFDRGFPQTYKPTLLDSSNPEQDNFFADLGEIGEDPLNLFGQGFSRNDLDPFSFYDWATTTTTASAAVADSGRKS